ncbi:MAG: tetratricopeptide repeat protein, partial [candidate division NC10 bacterium]|nr:tetratricopeptide repeat protein [candidate division NC10 bacterium]
MALVRSRPVLHHPFAPWLAPPDQLARTLVGREEALRNIIEKIDAMGKGGGAKHVLIIGPRGMGKTHLVCFIHHYVSQRIEARLDLPSLPKNWASVLFVEEEYPAHNTLANLLLSLCAKLHEADPVEEAWRLPETLRDQSDRVVTDCCLERIQAFSARRAKKLLILVDNVQKILQQFPAEDHHRLRAFLMDQTAFLLVGTAPWLFKEVIDYKAPFFEFFETVYLSDLTEEEMLRLLEARFREDGLEAEFRRREENLRRKIPAIRKLTGGNPRLILFLYDIVTRSAFLEVESALRELIEELSDYFRGRYDALADQPRKVLDTLAQMEGPGTPTEIARAARLSVQKVNAQLKRLKEWGYVEPLKHERRRATHYDVTERLFRIWRQTATIAGRQRFRFLAQFLKIYYTPEEMAGIVHSYRNELLAKGMLFPKENYRHAVEDLYYFQEAASGPLRHEIFKLRMEFFIHSGDYVRAEQEAEHFLAESVQTEDRAGMATAYEKEAEVHTAAGRYKEALKDVKQLLKMGHYQEALAVAEAVLDKTPTIAEVWASKGIATSKLGDHAKALESFEKAASLQPGDARYWRRQAQALLHLERYTEALACAERAVELQPDDVRAWEQRGWAAAWLDDDAKALESFQKATALQPKEADYWHLQAVALGNLKRYTEALACAERAVELRPGDAHLWEWRGIAARHLGDHGKALESFEKAAALQLDDANLLINKAWTLSSLGRTEEALAALEEALHRTGPERDIFHARGDILLLSGRFEEAREALEKGLALAPDDWDLLIDREIVRACQGEHGLTMEGLAAAILGAKIPSNAPPSIFRFLFDIAAKCT